MENGTRLDAILWSDKDAEPKLAEGSPPMDDRYREVHLAGELIHVARHAETPPGNR